MDPFESNHKGWFTGLRLGHTANCTSGVLGLEAPGMAIPSLVHLDWILETFPLRDLVFSNPIQSNQGFGPFHLPGSPWSISPLGFTLTH